MGLLLTGPLVAFGIIHIRSASSRPNRRAVRMGYALFATCLVLLGTGFLLMRVEGLFEIKSAIVRNAAYWLHVFAPLAAIWLYILHRLAGPRIKWRLGAGYGGAVAVLVVLMVSMHTQDPREWNKIGPQEGEQYFRPGLVAHARRQVDSRARDDDGPLLQTVPSRRVRRPHEECPPVQLVQ